MPGAPAQSDKSAVRLLAAAAPGHRAVGLAARVALGDRLPLVVRPLATGEGDLDLRPAVLEVQRQRDEGEAALLRLPDELGDLVPV